VEQRTSTRDRLDQDEAGVIFSRDFGGVAGYAVGVLHMASPFAFVPGNIQNATTMPFPVAYECVPSVTLQEVLSGHPKVEEGLVLAAQRLEGRGVRSIVGACGSFANFQRALTNAVSVPVFASVLVQVPWLLNCMSARRRLGIVFADRKSFTRGLQDQCGICDMGRLAITDCIDLAPFRALIDRPYAIAHEALMAAVTAHISSFARMHSDLGAVMLQCSELAPYAAAIQAAVGVPVIDVNTLVEWAHSISVRVPYTGYL
jgi:Asp/Glu/hydantoin racemase